MASKSKKSEKITKRANKKRAVLSRNLSRGLERGVKKLRGAYRRRRSKLNNSVKRQRTRALKRGN